MHKFCSTVYSLLIIHASICYMYELFYNALKYTVSKTSKCKNTHSGVAVGRAKPLNQELEWYLYINQGIGVN